MHIIKLNNSSSLLIENKTSHYFFLENDILDKKIKNPETGRNIKISTALGYEDENPSLYNKVKNFLKKVISKKDDSPTKNNDKEEDNSVKSKSIYIPKTITDEESKQRKEKLKKELTPKKIEDFEKSNDIEKVETLYSTPKGIKRDCFEVLLKNKNEEEIESLIQIIDSDIEDADYEGNEELKFKAEVTKKILKNIIIYKQQEQEKSIKKSKEKEKSKKKSGITTSGITISGKNSLDKKINPNNPTRFFR